MKNKLAIVSWNTEHSSPLVSPGNLLTVVPLKGFSLHHKTATKLIPIKLCSKENELLWNGDRAAPFHGLGGEAEKVSWPRSSPRALSYWDFSEEGFSEGANPALLKCRELARDAQHLTEQTPSDSTRTKRLQGQRDAENVNLCPLQPLSVHTARISH